MPATSGATTHVHKPCGIGGLEACSGLLLTSDKPTVLAIAIAVKPSKIKQLIVALIVGCHRYGFIQASVNDFLDVVVAHGYARFISTAAFQVLVS